nr:ribonuclease H-like domain-containing protein [Tanacetum cinerariifolium]
MTGDDNRNGDQPETSNLTPPAMKIEHYLSHTDYLIWQVIQNGNGPVSLTTDTNGMIKALPPKTAEEQQFKGFSVSASEGLHKMYDRFQTLLCHLEIHGAGVLHENANQKFLRSLPSSWSQVGLIMRTKRGLDTLSFDDLYNNLRVFERDVKGTISSSSSNTQNVAFVFADNISSTNDVSTAYSVSLPSVSKSHKKGSSSYTDEVAMISMRIKKFYKRTGRKLQFDTKDPVGFDKTKVEYFNCHKLGHFARDCRAKGNQDRRRRDCRNSGSDNEVKSYSKTCAESYARLKKLYDEQRDKLGDASVEITAYTLAFKKSVFINKECNLEDTPVNDRYVQGMHAVPPLMIGSYMPFGPDVEIDYSKFTYGPKQTSVDESDAKTYENASCESDSSVETTTTIPALVDNSPKRMAKQVALTKSKDKVTGQRDNILVWNNVQRVKHQNNFVPSVLLTKTGKFPVNAARQNYSRKATSTSTASKVNTVRSFVNETRQNKYFYYQEFKGGSVAFGGSNGRITGKGKIKADRLDFEDIYYVEELKHYNLFSVSQMCDNKNKKGKKHKASCKAKTMSSVNQPLQILHMDLFGPTSRVKENLHVNFPENKPNVAGKGHAWMFDLDYLTNSMNYEHVLVVNQANKFAGPKEANHSAGRQANDDQCANSEEIALNDEHFVLPIWSTYLTNVKSSGTKTKKTTDCKTCEKPASQVEQIFQEELKKLKRHENKANDVVRKEATHEYQDANTNSTNLLNAVSAPISTVGPLRALNDGESSYPDDPSMPHLEDIYASPSEGIFTNLSFDDECVVYKVVKALYGLHQAPRAWYATMLTFLEKSRYRRGAIDKTLFIKQDKKDIMLVQVYVDDIIFGSTKKSWCDEFEELIKNRFQMSSIGYSKTSHLQFVKRIFRYLKGQPKLGLWYPKVSSFDLEAYSNSDYAGANLDRKSTTGGCQFLDIQCAGFDTRPPMLDRADFASWQQHIRLYCQGKENGVNILKSIDEGPYQMGTVRETLAENTEGVPQFSPERPRVYSDMSPEEKD